VSDDSDSRLAIVRGYHERTKHRLDAYAHGPEYLDWDSQPDPFRRYADTSVVQLPLTDEPASIARQTPGLASIAALLQYSMGLSAWKQYGQNRWALRCNPSSGNLHPTEAYVVSHAIEGLADGVYHYAPQIHALERRADVSAPSLQPRLLIGLSSIVWREAWKYGERAFRYVQLDTGHALGALRYAAQMLGLELRMLSVSELETSTLMGLTRQQDFSDAENEIGELLLEVIPPATTRPLTRSVLPTTDQWHGQANPLGGEPRHRWPVLGEVAAASAPPAWAGSSDIGVHFLPTLSSIPRAQLPQLITSRRSAQAYRPATSRIDATQFYRIMEALLPGSGQAPLDCWPHRPFIHPLIFIHRVQGLPQGLYALPRTHRALQQMRRDMHPDFTWSQPATCPAHIPLYRLHEQDMRKQARMIACHQEIASASSFSLGMLAEFDDALETHGPGGYRLIFQEAGLLGQILYLQSEAIGKRGTGIGCFFDDEMHDLLGLRDQRFQDVYHFTMGDPLIDERLQTLPPYAQLRNGDAQQALQAQQRMFELKQKIAGLYKQRESLKQALEAGAIKPAQGFARLDTIDAELSELDSAYKLLWDKHNASTASRDAGLE